MEKLKALGMMVLLFIESTFERDDWAEWWRDEEDLGFSVQDFWLCMGLAILVWIIMQFGAWALD